MDKDNDIDLIIDKLKSIKLARERMHERSRLLAELKRDCAVVSLCCEPRDAAARKHKHNPVEASVAEIEKLEMELLESTKAFADKWTAGAQMINSIAVLSDSGRVDVSKSEQCQRVMERRYILGQKWETIASEMNYSWCQVMRLHRRALKALKDNKKLNILTIKLMSSDSPPGV